MRLRPEQILQNIVSHLKMLQREDNMKKEYDFSSGVRGKYSKRYQEGTNLVRLDPEVKKAFPTSKDVNKALKTILTAFDPKKKSA